MPNMSKPTATCSAPESASARPALWVFSDDWGRHPSSCQHLVRHLLGEYRVFWVNTIGTRQPKLDWATLRRAAEKTRQWLGLGPRSAVHPALTILNPWMWPSFSRLGDRRINRWLLVRQLAPRMRASPTPVVAITTLPIVADLMGHLPATRWVYYCVDDFTEWPGMDQQAMYAMESILVQRADVLIAASRTLQDRLANLGRNSRLLTHGVDLEHWSATASTSAPTQLERCQRPVILFWGLIDQRLDLAWLGRLSAQLPRGTIVLVGPESDPDPRLRRLARTVVLAPVSYDRLPALAQAADVLIMPYADLPVTRAMQPLKLKEYLATGKPVVARQLPAVLPWADALDCVSTAEQFCEAVLLRWAQGVPESQRVARQRLAMESWAAKARQFARWALGEEPAACEEAPHAG